MHICICFLGHFVFTTTLTRNISKHCVCLASHCLVSSNQIAASRAEHDVTDTSMAMPSNKVVTNANIKLNFNLILHKKKKRLFFWPKKDMDFALTVFESIL